MDLKSIFAGHSLLKVLWLFLFYPKKFNIFEKVDFRSNFFLSRRPRKPTRIKRFFKMQIFVKKKLKYWVQFAKEPRCTITKNSWKTTSPSFSQQILKYLNFWLKTINYSEKTVIKSSTTKKYRQFVYKLMSFLNIFNKKKFVVICMASSYWITNIISNFYNIFTQ